MPLTLDLSRVVHLTDGELFQLCTDNRELHIERNADGEIEIMAPAGGGTSTRNVYLVVAVSQWNDKHGDGVTFGPDGGFLLPKGAMRAPDVAWVRRDRWETLSEEEQEKFVPLCPDFVIELRSPSDHRPALDDKMVEWMENGCRLAWLIDPVEREATVYRSAEPMEVVGFEGVLRGDDVLPGLEVDLSRLP